MTQDFKPEYMQMAVLTAALQELTPRDKRRQDPDLAVEDWIRFGRELGVHRLQLSSALPEELADVPPEAMLDPVADHLNVLKPLDPEPRAAHPVRAQGLRDELLGPRLLRQHARGRRAGCAGSNTTGW